MTSELIKTDVTVVKFFDQFILAGIGNCLSVYNKVNLTLINKYPIFYGQKIHGIHAINSKKLLIFGGNQFSICSLNITEDDFSILNIEHCKYKDWILDIFYNVENDDEDEIILVTSHNVVAQRFIGSDKFLETQCDEKCIIYFANIIKTKETIFILTGTVFSEIVIWAPKISSQVLHRLKGHEGVIFSVMYSEKKSLLSSTSDDRSIKLWNVNGSLLSQNVESLNNLPSNNSITLKCTLYGHSARVWRSTILEDCLISIGEDSIINIWSLEGQLLRRINTDQNDYVWCLDCDENSNLIATGGGDSGIYLYPIKYETRIETLNLPENENNYQYVMKRVAILKNFSIACVTENGDLFFIENFTSKKCKLINNHSEIKHVLLEISCSKDFIALAGCRTANIYIYTLQSNNLVLFNKITISEIYGLPLSLHWLPHGTILLCGNNGQLTEVLEISSEIKKDVLRVHGVLPEMKERWLTAATLFEDYLLIVGDRGGNVHVFQENCLIQTISKLHSNLGIGCLLLQNNILISTGRDGTVKKHCIKNDHLCLISVAKLPFKWCCQVFPDFNIVVGFMKTRLQIQKLDIQRTLLDIECGGGHRCWDLVVTSSSSDSLIGYFSFIREKKLHITQFLLNTVQVVEVGFHGREINHMISLTRNNRRFLISGGEDTSMRISEFNKNLKSNFRVVNIQNSHLSNIRCITSITTKNDKTYIISGGGRAQIVISLLVNQFDCVELLSHTLKTQINQTKASKKAIIDLDPETRIMDLDVFENSSKNLLIILAACSDSFLRVFSFDYIEEKELKLLCALNDFNPCCILKSKILNKSNDLLIFCSGSTNGRLIFWKYNLEINTIEKLIFFQRHQSGINVLNYKIMDDRILISSGGDDCKIALNLFKTKSNFNEVALISLWESSKFHYSQVNGSIFIKSYVVFGSIDQRITLLKYSISNDGVFCEFVKQFYTTVSDVQGICDLSNYENNDFMICVYGKGFEIFNLNQFVKEE